MKIQLQNPSFYPEVGGIENYLYYSSKALLKLGHKPTILCSKLNPFSPIKETYQSIEIIRHSNYNFTQTPLTLLNPIYYTKKIQRFLQNNSKDYDMIWSRGAYEAYASGKVLKNKMPIIFIQAAIGSTFTRIGVENQKLRNRLHAKFIAKELNFIEKRAIEMSGKVVTLSHNRMKEVCNFYDLRKDKFKVIPPGVDLKFFKPSKKDFSLLKELNLSKKSKIILTICRLSNEKNLGMLINAFNKIRTKDTYLIIVGEGTERRYLEQMIKKLNLSKNVILTGNRTDVKRFYSIAEVFVLPSKYEGFGQVFLEAMASGIPCIGLRPDYPEILTACDEIIQEGVTGYLVDAYSIDDLADKIIKIIQDNNLKIKLGENSRKICEKNYSWEKCIQSLLKLSKKTKV